MTGQFKKLRITTAMVLALLMFVLIPVQAGAVAQEPATKAVTDGTDSTVTDAPTEEAKPAEILAEVVEDRDQYTKHFRMSNGSFMAAQYEYPVHFKDKDGDWVDYDNRMVETETQPVTEEQTDAPTQAAIVTNPATEAVSVTEQNTAAATDASDVTNGANARSVQEETATTEAPTDVVQATQPQAEALDAGEDSAEFANKKSDIDIRLANKAKKNNMVKIKSDGFQISWGFTDINKSKIQFVENKEKLEGNDTFTVQKNLVSEALYKEAFPNVDMQYLVTPVGVKENIILKTKDARTSFEIEYKLKGLTAVQKNNYIIELQDNEGKVVYEISAPFMTDAKGERSTQLNLTIKSQNNNKLTVDLTADQNWLNDGEREFPVTVDPSFNTSQSWQKTACSFIDQSNPTTAYGYGSETGYTGTVYAGTLGGSKNYRTFLKMNELPKLNNGDIVVEAYLSMHLFQDTFYDDMFVGAYHVKDSWKQSTVTWNTRPNFESNIVDYKKLHKDVSKDSPWVRWDVSKSVKRWYRGEANNGIMLKPVDEASNAQCASFYSSNYPEVSNPRPAFMIIYRNNKGLDDHWTYTSFNAGTAGTASVNDYTGNLVFTHSDASTGGSLMPLSINHVFNNYMAGITYTKSPPLTGKGWRLSIQQTVLPSSDFGLTGDAAKLYPYVYTDGDGTDHYFYNKGTEEKPEYEDEDGMKLKLTVAPSSVVARYVITDEKDNKMEFKSNGLLYKIIDAYGNYIFVKYAAGDSKTIEYVQDGAKQKITFVPNSSGSGSLSRMKDPAGREKIFYYDPATGYMTQIRNPDGTNVYFTYDSAGSLTSVEDIDGYKVNFGYSSAATGKQVTSIQEYGTNGAAGQKVTFDRSEYNTTVVQTAGIDGIYGNTDDLVTTMQFDDWGRTTSIKSQTGNRDLGAAGCQYTSGSPNADGSNLSMINRVTNQYSLGSNAVNLLTNHNMEATGSWTSAAWGGSNTFTAANTTEQKYLGKQSLKINTTAVTGTASGRVYQDLSSTVLKPNTSYTLSAYIKTTGFNTTASNTGALIGATSFNSANTATDIASELIQNTTDTAINNGWRRITLTFKVPADSVKTRINLALRGTTGTAYFDAVQIEEYNNVNTYNMLENSSLENYGTGNLPLSWNSSTMTSSDDGKTTSARTGSYAYQIKGDPTTKKELYQSVNVTGVEEDTYIVSGWAKANAAKEKDGQKKFKLSVLVTYSDGSSTWKRAADFNSGVSDWQFTSSAFTLSDGTSTKKTPTKIDVYIVYNYQINTAIFDNIQLIKDVAQSYTYDKDGKIISVQKDAEQKGTMEYTNADLTKSIDAKGYEYTYKYNKQHSMTTATSQRGMISTYTYDEDKGVPTQLEVQNPSKTVSLLATVGYTANKAYVSKSTDQDGNEVTFDYNDGKDANHVNTGTLKSASDSTGTVNYTYNANNDLLTGVSKYLSDDDTTLSNQYTYTAGTSRNLMQIKRNGTNYNIEYDAFNNKTSTKVGTQTLATYTYGANNGLLQKQTYGTGQYAGYSYDAFGNTSAQSLNGVTAFQWFSDRTGALTRMKDLLHGIQYDNDYDVTGRLVRQTAVSIEDNSNVYSMEYGYDLNNNISKLINIADGKTAKNEYVYGKDNLPEKYTIDGGRDVTYTFDTLNRLTKTSVGTTAPLDTTYEYYISKRNAAGSDKYRTTKISYETIAGQRYGYEYDEQGNIVQIKKQKDGVYVSQHYYEYDQAGQLIYDRNDENNLLKTYSYDEGGNIVSEGTSVLVNGRPVSSTTKNYAYGDSNWTDKLTSYDGQSITYDAIGNPLNYRDGMAMTWQNGRQLSSLQKGNNRILYTYDSGSVRATKTVDGVKYTYQYINGKLIHETRGEKSFHYYYDALGYLTAIKYRLTADGSEYAYYATHNSRGDVLGLYNGSGALVAQYEYDSWGNVLSIKNASGAVITDLNNVGNLNAIRYRGYYQDAETGLYYLMSRYYDPVTHRFLNADGYFQSGNDILDANMNAYCRNNPISYADAAGTRCYYSGSEKYNPHCHTGSDGFCYSCYTQNCCEPWEKEGKTAMEYFNQGNKTSSNSNKQEQFNTGSNITNNAVNGIKTAINTIGKNLTGTEGAVLAATGYAVTTPIAITFHCVNPGLNSFQKFHLASLELLNAAGGIILATAVVSMSWNPGGWAGVGLCIVYSYGMSAMISSVSNSYLTQNELNKQLGITSPWG